VKLNRATVAAAAARRGLTNQALADALGVHRSAVQQWLAGDKSPSADHLLALGRALKIDPRKLAG